MNQRRHLTVIAAVTTLMAAAPLSTLYVEWTWAIDCLIAVSVVCGTALGARALRAPTWAQPLASLGALLLIVTWLNPSGDEFIGIPTGATFAHFGDLIASSGQDMRNLAIPVYDRPGLLFLTTVGVGLCAIVVDFVAVVLRRPALAGLPMLAIYAVPVAIDAGSVSVISFIIAAAGYMWLLVTDNIDRVRLFGRRFSGEGRGIDMWEPSPLAAVGRRIAVIGVLLAIIVPVATPGLSRGLFGQLGQGLGNGDGSGNCRNCVGGTRVDLFANLAGNLNDDKEQVLAHITTNDPNPPYLRFGVADTLTRKGFASGQPAGLPVSQGLPNPPFSDADDTGARPVVFAHHDASVSIGLLDMRVLPIFLAPTSGSLQSIGDVWRFDPGTAVLFSTEASTQGLSYKFGFDHPDFTPDLLRTAQRLPATNPIQAGLTKVPTDVKLVDTIIAQQTRDTTNEYDTVRGLYDYFAAKNGFVYSLSTKAGTSGSDIGNFLTNKRGYCVQYAAALAWLVRAANYPARVAFGFTQGKLDSPGVYTLSNRNLHAWTEVYFQGFGWVPFDATPSAGIQGSIRTGWAPNVDLLTPTRSGSDGTDVGPSANPSGSGASGLGHRLDQGEDTGAGALGGNSTTTWPWWVLGGFLILLALAAAPSVARVLIRIRRATTEKRISSDTAEPGEPWVVVDDESSIATTRQRVHAAWDEFIDTLIDYRVPIDPAQTPRTMTDRVARSLYLPEEASAGIRSLGISEERARYAKRPGTSESTHEIVQTVRRALAARVSTRTRLRAMLLPPSVTARWGTNAMATITRIVAWSQSTRDTVSRTVSIRRWFTASGRAAAARTR